MAETAGINMAFYEELYSLSPNQDLFTALQTGKELPALHDSTKTESEEQRLFCQIRNAIIESLHKNDPAPISDLSGALPDDNRRLQLYGEILLAWSAATNSMNEKYAKTLRTAATPLINLQPSQPIHARALREWLCVLLGILSSGTGQRPADLTPEQWLNMNYVRASHTNQCRPGLVGESFYLVGQAAKGAGDTAKWKQCAECVYKDMGMNLDRDNLPQNLRFEAYGILYWYQKACADLQNMEPTLRQEIQSNLDRLQRRYEGASFEPTGPAMLGPMARTYLSRMEYLKRVLREIRQSNSDDLAVVCYKYDYCHEIDTYLFALERHEMVLPILGKPVKVNYEPAVQEALDALLLLDQEESAAVDSN